MRDDEYVVRSSSLTRDINIKVKDSVRCSDGSTMVIRIDITFKYTEQSSYYNDDKSGNFVFSITKIKTDSHGTPMLFSRTEKSAGIDLDEMEFSENFDNCKIKKDIFDKESNINYCFDIKLEELTRNSKKNSSTDKSLQRKIEKEEENINSMLEISGKINDDSFSENAEASLTVSKNKQTVSVRKGIMYF